MSNAYIDGLPTAELLRSLKRKEEAETEKAALAARLCSAPQQDRRCPILVLDTNVLMDIWVFGNPASGRIRAAERIQGCCPRSRRSQVKVSMVIRLNPPSGGPAERLG